MKQVMDIINQLGGIESSHLRIDPQGMLATIGEIESGADKGLLQELRELGEGAIDCCGTGGSGIRKFNLSTTIAFILAACELPVVKFANRSATGSSGSVDFLESLGIATRLSPQAYERVLSKTNLLFLNAQDVYPQMRELAPLRKKIGRPTIFNYIGPLLNPVKPSFRLLGVSNLGMFEVIARYLSTYEPRLTRCLLVHSQSGLDELNPLEANASILINRSRSPGQSSTFEGGIPRHELQSQTAGLSCSLITCPPHDNELRASATLVTQAELVKLFSKDPQVTEVPSAGKKDLKEYQESSLARNVSIFQRIVNAEDESSDDYRSVLLNAAAAMLAAGAVNKLDAGIEKASGLLASGLVRAQVEKTRRVCNEYSV